MSDTREQALIAISICLFITTVIFGTIALRGVEENRHQIRSQVLAEWEKADEQTRFRLCILWLDLPKSVSEDGLAIDEFMALQCAAVKDG